MSIVRCPVIAGPSRQHLAAHKEVRMTASAAALPSSPAANSLHQSAPDLRMQHSFSHATLEELRAATEKFAIEREWEKFHSPRNLLLALVSTEWLFGSICLPCHLSCGSPVKVQHLWPMHIYGMQPSWLTSCRAFFGTCLIQLGPICWVASVS